MFEVNPFKHYSNTVAFGMGGGGGGPAPEPRKYADPTTGRQFNTPEELNAYLDTQEKTQRDNSFATDREAELRKSQQRDAWITGSLSNAINQGTENVNSYFRSQGVDPSAYMGDITRAINSRRNSIQDLDPNPMAAFDDNLAKSILGDINSGVQSRARSSLDSIFTPDWANRKLASGTITPLVDAEVEGLFNPLADQLSNAYKRHTLNDQGYAAAQQKLGSDRTAARSQIQGIADSILTNNRKGLDDYISGARDTAGRLTATTAGSFDPNSYLQEADRRANASVGSFSGDLKSALGSSTFTDLQSLLNAGGQAQGAIDPTATNPNGGVGSIASSILSDKKRGLGTQGAF